MRACSLALCRVRTHWESATHKPGSGLSPDPGFADTLILDFLASRTMGNECLLFKLKKKTKTTKTNFIIQFYHSGQIQMTGTIFHK